MARGFVSEAHGEFVRKGLWFGFDLGVDMSKVTNDKDQTTNAKRSNPNYCNRAPKLGMLPWASGITRMGTSYIRPEGHSHSHSHTSGHMRYI